MSLKEILYKKCAEFIENRLQTIQEDINEIQESLLSETKSSAGDKHETGRAMLQLEHEKAGQQLAEVQKVKEILSKIDVSNTSKNVCLASVVYTSQANYFISISAGKLTVNDDLFYAISQHTPIAQLLLGKSVGDTLKFRAQKFTIIQIK